MSPTLEPLRIAVLVKQIPAVEEMRLGPDGRLVRDGAAMEMSAYCRRAVSKSVELAKDRPGSSVVVVTMGPPSAHDVLREAIAWGTDQQVEIRGALVSDPAFAGSDTIATARALAAAMEREGPFDLVLTGKNSLDADTGQVPPQVAELLDLPFVSGVKDLALDGRVVQLGCEHDDSWLNVEAQLPVLLSCAERLCEPAKVPPDRRAAVPDHLLTTHGAGDLGSGPWGTSGSLTTVGASRQIAVDRLRQLSPDAPLTTQVKEAVEILLDRGALAPREAVPTAMLPKTGGPGQRVAVIAEPGQAVLSQELCAVAARLASEIGGSTVLLAEEEIPAAEAGSWGADLVVHIAGAEAVEDVARAVSSWADSAAPWAILVGSTAYGREVASRVAASIGAGLTGDAVDIEVADDRLLAWKPAFGGQLVVAINATSAVQMATIRAGVLPRRMAREHVAEVRSVTVEPRRRVRVKARRQEDSLEALGEADVVIGFGKGVAPDEVGGLDELRGLLGAEIGCTRKLTDAGWMPHARQIGITGRSIAPRLYIAIGTSGKFNHMVGVRAAGMVLAINPDRDAPLWSCSDVGVVGSWQETVPLLVAALRETLAPS